MTSDVPQPKNPLHGVTLSAIVEHLVDVYGWEDLGQRVAIRCFQVDPSVTSSLKFLRKTPWAREKVESLYLYSLRRKHKKRVAPIIEDTVTDAAAESDQVLESDNVWLRDRKP
jgi:uncharacterized protein (DUF2132 family)